MLEYIIITFMTKMMTCFTYPIDVKISP